jgi:ubiquinone/menaquinone biosynthesis C-methylase UbiE
MDSKHINTIKDDYNSWAGVYDSNNNKTRDLDKKATVETLSKYTFKKAIELGCGTGKNTAFLAQKADQVIALDFSEKMIQIAKSKFKEGNVSFHTTDITKNWEIENEFADLITCSLVLEHIENLNHIFSQSVQKLKNGGLFFISELHPAKQYLGSKAKYESPSGVRELETFTHHITDYLQAAKNNGFKLLELNEWFDEPNQNEIPRLLSFVFQK